MTDDPEEIVVIPPTCDLDQVSSKPYNIRLIKSEKMTEMNHKPGRKRPKTIRLIFSTVSVSRFD